MITGTYAAGTTTADLDAYLTSGSSDTPEWWRQETLIGVLTGARDVWFVDGSSDTTALCFLDSARLWEIAGPRLSD